MDIYDIEMFANHKYGENVYLINSREELIICTNKSKWRIIWSDIYRFHEFSLYHLNHTTDREHYHKQCASKNVSWLVYYAICHDLDIPTNFAEFSRLYDMYMLGREIEEDIARFNFFCEDEDEVI